MSGKKQKKRVVNSGPFKFVQQRQGYAWEIVLNESTVALPSSAGEKPTLSYHMSLKEMHEAFRKRLSSEYRIFDWKTWEARRDELDPVAGACIEVLQRIENLQVLIEGKVDQSLLIISGMNLGRSLERVSAQSAWAKRNPPPSASEVIKVRVKARRAALAEYMQNPETIARSDTRPGPWYAGFREAYPDHAASDRTLKDDYPHALAIVRKQMKKDSTKRG